MPFMTPTETGYWWGKLIEPVGEPAGEDWKSRDFEIVRVDIQSDDYGEHLVAYLTGIEDSQSLAAFTWGPRLFALSGAHFSTEANEPVSVPEMLNMTGDAKFLAQQAIAFRRRSERSEKDAHDQMQSALTLERAARRLMKVMAQEPTS